MRVSIIENTAITHHGMVGVALHEAGALIDQWTPFADGRLPDTPATDALIVFGGEQNALADDTHPYLPALAALMRAYGDAGKPVLGICLGAQLLARAYGGENRIGTAPEFGWVDVALTDHGRDDPVLAGPEAPFPIFQWHSDTFALPEEAVHLARSDTVANQCFRIGQTTYGMQFHFEASRAVVADWTLTFPAATERMAPGWIDQHPALARTKGEMADAAGLRIARNWVRLVSAQADRTRL